MMHIDYREARKLIIDKLKFKPDNCSARTCWIPKGEDEYHVGLFLSDCEDGYDFYFLACKKFQKDIGKFEIRPGEIEIYKIPRSVLDNYKTTSKALIREGKNTQYLYKLSQCIKVYDEKDEGTPLGFHEIEKSYPEEIDLQGDDLQQNRLTMRDRVCLDLLVPKSGKQWINTLIKSSPIYKYYKQKLSSKYD